MVRRPSLFVASSQPGRGRRSLWPICGGGDEACGFGHAVAGDEGPAEGERFLEKGFCEVLATDEGEAQGWGRFFAQRDEVKDLGGDEGGDGDSGVGEPLVKGGGVPFGREASEGPPREFGAMDEAVAADMKLGEGEAPDVFGGAIEVVVDGLGTPIEALLRMKDPFGFAGGAAGRKEAAFELRVGLRELLSLLDEMRRGGELSHDDSLTLGRRFGKGGAAVGAVFAGLA